MSKQISPLIYRINRFNNYKNTWVIKYNKVLKILLYKYIILKKLFQNFYINLKFNYFNNNIKIYGQLYKYKIESKLYNNIIILFYCYNKIIKIINIYINLYQLTYSLTRIQFLKLFIKINLSKNIPIKHIYQQLYNILLNNYNKNQSIFYSVKIVTSGRLEGEELATSEIFKFGTLLLQQIDIHITYEQFDIITKYGLIGIKIWIGKFI